MKVPVGVCRRDHAYFVSVAQELLLAINVVHVLSGALVHLHVIREWHIKIHLFASESILADFALQLLGNAIVQHFYKGPLAILSLK